MNDTLLGVIVGASAAILSSIIAGIISEILNSHLQIKRENRDMLRVTFENAKKLMFIASNDKVNLTKELIMETKIKMSIYATKKINNKFDMIIENIDKEIEINQLVSEFNAIIKTELKISK